MKKINTAPLSGMQELLPAKQAVFSEIKRKIGETFRLHGFCEIETPVIERTEILLAKAGGETEKQIYFVQKTGEDENAERSKEALRFDNTVPLARYVVEHANEIAFPFKVTQVARVFRGERPQRGRFREFYQCDVDIIGRDNLPLSADAEIIATLARALEVFRLESLVVRISNRKLLSGLLNALELENIGAEIMGVIDRAEKVSPEKTMQTLGEYGVRGEKLRILQKFMQIRGDSSEVNHKLMALEIKNAQFEEGLKELVAVLELLEQQNLPTKVQADMLIVRGLDYYTGTVFETFAEDHREIGSLCSGGRYENLTANFGEQRFPGVGGSIGLTRLFYILNELGLIPKTMQAQELMMIVPISEREQTAAIRAAEKLRAEGKAVSVVLMEKKLGQKMTYAAKTGTHAVVIGETEAETGRAEIKDLMTGERTELIF